MKKKFIKRCLSCVLSLVCIFSGTIRIHAAANESYTSANELTLSLEIDREIIVPVYEQEMMFEFTPERTGSYSITVQGCDNMECVLYDKTKENIVMKGRSVWDTQKKKLPVLCLKKYILYWCTVSRI